MKLTLLSALLSVGFLIGQSHAQDTKRIPASVNDVEVSKPEPDVCGLYGSVEKRIRDCSEQKLGFVLVTRTKNLIEVYKEVSTGLLWSDRLYSKTSYFEALDKCLDLEEVAGISGLSWRLPSIYEYKKAEKNGIRKALPNMNFQFWSSTVPQNSDDSRAAWSFYGYDGTTHLNLSIIADGSVRCVAR